EASRSRMVLAPAGVAIVMVLGLASSARADSGGTPLTLERAVAQALRHNPEIRALQYGAAESHAKVVSARAGYLPEVKAEVSYQGTSDRHETTVQQGSLGDVPGLGPFPTEDVHLAQGKRAVLLGTTTVTQPLTPLYKINRAHVAALADERAANANLEG